MEAENRQNPLNPSNEMEKPCGRSRSPRIAKSRYPESPSTSPHSKRLRRVKSEKESKRIGDRDHDNNHRRGSKRSRQRETESYIHGPAERRERRSGRDDSAHNNQFSKSRHERSASPSDYSHRLHQGSRSPVPANRRERDEGTQIRGDDHRNNGNDSLAKMKAAEEALHSKEKAVEKPSFELSGKLAAETNRVRGITLLFNEPPEARKPDIRWRLYVLKNGDVLNEPLYVHRQSCYLFGRERRVADIPTDHPSCSKQHAVLQYREVEKENSDGTLSKQVKPYIMDLGSTNGTFINEDRIEPQRYYELLEKDNIRFGNSSRMYVLLHENSAG